MHGQSEIDEQYYTDREMHVNSKLGFHAPYLEGLDDRNYTKEEIELAFRESQLISAENMRRGAIPGTLFSSLSLKGPKEALNVETAWQFAAWNIRPIIPNVERLNIPLTKQSAVEACRRLYRSDIANVDHGRSKYTSSKSELAGVSNGPYIDDRGRTWDETYSVSIDDLNGVTCVIGKLPTSDGPVLGIFFSGQQQNYIEVSQLYLLPPGVKLRDIFEFAAEQRKRFGDGLSPNYLGFGDAANQETQSADNSTIGAFSQLACRDEDALRVVVKAYQDGGYELARKSADNLVAGHRCVYGDTGYWPPAEYLCVPVRNGHCFQIILGNLTTESGEEPTFILIQPYGYPTEGPEFAAVRMLVAPVKRP